MALKLPAPRDEDDDDEASFAHAFLQGRLLYASSTCSQPSQRPIHMHERKLMLMLFEVGDHRT